jgi:photosystem II stability/assembly factor-like uncharacterized protein
LKTIDAGANWSFLTSGTTIDLKSVYFTDANTGYAVGESGLILKTIDAGANWMPFISIDHFTYLNSITFPETCTGYAVGRTGKIFQNEQWWCRMEFTE